MYLLPFYHPEGPSPLINEDGWKFFVVCEDKNGDESAFFDAMDGLGENRQGDFSAMLRQLTKLAASGKPWENLCPDRRQMHHVGEVRIRHASGSMSSKKVWEFKHADLRILWCYGGEGRVILFGNVLVKNQNKIDPADVAVVEGVMNDYTKAYESGQIKIAGGKENEQAFGALFSTSATRSHVRKKGALSRPRR